MSRRRLRLACSSDEEEDDDVQEVQPPPPQRHDIESETLNLQGVSLNSLNSNPICPPDAAPIEILDEEFIDAAEDLPNSPPPPPPPPSPPPPPDSTFYSTEYSTTSSVGTNQASDSPISRILEDLGLRLRGEWLDSCLNGLQTAIPQFLSLDATKKAKLCFERFLHSDMNYCGAGLLPSNVHQMHLVDLPGPFVLQVDEIVNISQPLRERYKKANSGLKRCLKLSMTDGVQRVFGMEYQPIKDLDSLAPAGLKVAISNVTVRHGLLMLVPEVIQVLGGLVEELDAARQRLVTEVNKPPRGKRTRNGVVPPLATRATRAAWPANDTSVSQSPTPMQVDDQVPVHRERGGDQPPRTEVESSVPIRRMNTESFRSTRTTESSVNTNMETVETVREETTATAHRVPPRIEVESSVPIRRMNTEPLRSTRTTETSVNMNMENASSVNRETVETVREETVVSARRVPPRTEVESSFSIRRMNTEPFRSTRTTESSVSMNMDNASSVNRETVETVRKETNITPRRAPPMVFSVDENPPVVGSDNPFTYLANLSKEWAASKDKVSHVEGKIKCFVTGVKKFQFKNRKTYELQVYVDDGSLISEILIDHNIVQKKIGYSPEETNAALSSPDSSRVQAMKNMMMQFQVYLVNFEGIMMIRINEALSIPVAIDMQQGCSLSDSWMLLRRLKSRNDDRRSQLDPIILSP